MQNTVQAVILRLHQFRSGSQEIGTLKAQQQWQKMRMEGDISLYAGGKDHKMPLNRLLLHKGSFFGNLHTVVNFNTGCKCELEIQPGFFVIPTQQPRLFAHIVQYLVTAAHES